jgi:CheY-like chemotaxis protein
MHAAHADHGWRSTPGLHDVLVLDDSEFDRRRLARAIARAPFPCTVTEVEDLAALGHALNAKAFDVILIDYALADGDGLQALERCKSSQSNRHALFVMVTGNDSSSLAVDALKGGFDEYLAKDDIDHSVLETLLSASKRKRVAARAPQLSTPFLDFVRRDSLASDEASKDAAAPLADSVSDPDLREAAQEVTARLQKEGFGPALNDLFDAPEPGFEFKTYKE